MAGRGASQGSAASMDKVQVVAEVNQWAEEDKQAPESPQPTKSNNVKAREHSREETKGANSPRGSAVKVPPKTAV